MFKDLAILLGVPAAVYFLTRLTGRERAAMIAGGLTLAGLLAIFVPNFRAAKERRQAVQSAFLAFRQAAASRSPEATQWLVSSEQQALEEAAKDLGGKVRAGDLLELIAPSALPHEELSVQMAGPEQAIVHIAWQEAGTMGLLHGEQVLEIQSVQESGEWKFSLGEERLRSAVQAYARYNKR